jgi:hypothetical protein
MGTKIYVMFEKQVNGKWQPCETPFSKTFFPNSFFTLLSGMRNDEKKEITPIVDISLPLPSDLCSETLKWLDNKNFTDKGILDKDTLQKYKHWGSTKVHEVFFDFNIQYSIFNIQYSLQQIFQYFVTNPTIRMIFAYIY